MSVTFNPRIDTDYDLKQEVEVRIPKDELRDPPPKRWMRGRVRNVWPHTVIVAALHDDGRFYAEVEVTRASDIRRPKRITIGVTVEEGEAV